MADPPPGTEKGTVHQIIEDLLKQYQLGWLAPTIRQMILEESGGANPYILNIGSNYRDKHGKLHEPYQAIVKALEEATGQAWDVRLSSAPTELSVGLWQQNIGSSSLGGLSVGTVNSGLDADAGKVILQDGTIRDATHDDWVQAILFLADPLEGSIPVLNKFQEDSDRYQGLGLSTDEAAKRILEPWATSEKALAAVPVTADYTGSPLAGTGLTGDPDLPVDLWSAISIENYRDIYGNFDASRYMADLSLMATVYAQAGMELPTGAPKEAQVFFEAAKGLIEDDPLAKQLATLEVEQMTQQISQSGQLFPFQIDEIRQRIQQSEEFFPIQKDLLEQQLRLNEPFAAEAILRSPGGQQGYKDYWAGNPPDQQFADDTDYMAGFRFGESEKRPQELAGLATYMDRVLDEIDVGIDAGQLRTTQVVEQVRTALDAFTRAGTQFRDIQPFTAVPGREFVLQEGLTSRLGLEPTPQTPINFDPFGMALDIIKNNPLPTDVAVPVTPSTDLTAYNDVLDKYRDLIGV